LEWLETAFRPVDAQVGRLWGVDALAMLTPGISPMAFALNNPVSFNDPTGLMATDGEGELPVLYVPEVTIYANKDEETKGEETTSTDNIQDDKKRFADEYSSSWNPIYRNIALEFKKGNLNYVADANRKGTKIRWGAASLHSRFMREIHYLSEMMAVGVIGMTALMVAAPAIAELIAMDAAVDIASIGVDVATGNYADAAIDAGALLVPGVNAAEVKGADYAFGLSDDLFNFAKANGFLTYKDFSVGFDKDKILSVIQNTENHLHFNLTGFSMYQFSKFNPNNPLGHKNITNWELHTISKTEGALERASFYKLVNGEYQTVSNPLQK
jgi:hypothetical protein